MWKTERQGMERTSWPKRGGKAIFTPMDDTPTSTLSPYPPHTLITTPRSPPNQIIPSLGLINEWMAWFFMLCLPLFTPPSSCYRIHPHRHIAERARRGEDLCFNEGERDDSCLRSVNRGERSVGRGGCTGVRGNLGIR
jgi:hypothetical protein